MNIKDIAKLSGVGVSTVSRVLNSSGPVSETTRKKVMDVINANHFIPNSSAQNLKASHTKNIALFVKGVTSPFFNKIISVIEQKISLRNYSLSIQNVYDISNELDIAIQEAKSRNLNGVILLGGYYAYSETQFRELGIPCVLVTVSANSAVDSSLYSSVRIDDEYEGFRATEYLIKLGHRRIGFIFYNPAETGTPNSLRYSGYLRALKEYEIPFDPDLVAKPTTIRGVESSFSAGFQAMKHLYAKCPDITAVFSFADALAIGAAKAVFSIGLKIPDDISIIGFDGIDEAEYYQPSLDTIYQPSTEMALSCVDILFDMMQGGKAQHIVYPSMLLKRGSCRTIITSDIRSADAANK